MKILSRTVILLSFVSFFTDMASEMLYPIMPLYLQSIGFSVLLIGVLEGFAEAISGLSKGYFGKLSDIKGKRLPFVQAGYLLSALSKPLMIILTYPLWVFFARTLDRFGKGLRTGARDAMLSEETTLKDKGKIFGFHRGFDTLGAVVGPCLALAYLYFFPVDYKNLFIIAFVPGLISVGITCFIRKKKNNPIPLCEKAGFLDFLKFWKSTVPVYRRITSGFLAFALFNSSDFFLLLILKVKGYDDIMIIFMYIFYNLIYALSSYPMGFLGDKIGLKWSYLFGLFLFVLVYIGISVVQNYYFILILFALYGIFMAGTEGISKAWITNVVKNKDTATAVGTYTALSSVTALLSSSFAGFLWYNISPEFMFIFSASGALLVIIYLISNSWSVQT
ncbi:MAG: MFS transporter [Ignavibacteria bacterium]|nr:MFS transporter [Ignavibacteria bacterium]